MSNAIQAVMLMMTVTAEYTDGTVIDILNAPGADDATCPGCSKTLGNYLTGHVADESVCCGYCETEFYWPAKKEA